MSVNIDNVDKAAKAYIEINKFTKIFITHNDRLNKSTKIAKEINTTNKRSINIYISELEVTYDELIVIVNLYRQYHFASYDMNDFSLSECISFFMESYLAVCHIQKRNRK